MLVKTKFAYENLPGAKTVNGRLYPSPFYQLSKGSWNAGAKISLENKVRVAGGTEDKGTGATIRHRTFKDNPFAEQGTRPICIIVEEAGMCLGRDTKVRMYDLSLKNAQDIVPGDILLGPDGTPRTVEGTLSGNAPLFKVSQKYGNDYVVSRGHTLVLDQRCNVNSIKDDGIKKILVEDFNSLGKYRRRTTYGIKNEVLQFSNAAEVFEPYYIGL